MGPTCTRPRTNPAHLSAPPEHRAASDGGVVLFDHDRLCGGRAVQALGEGVVGPNNPDRGPSAARRGLTVPLTKELDDSRKGQPGSPDRVDGQNYVPLRHGSLVLGCGLEPGSSLFGPRGRDLALRVETKTLPEAWRHHRACNLDLEGWTTRFSGVAGPTVNTAAGPILEQDWRTPSRTITVEPTNQGLARFQRQVL